MANIPENCKIALPGGKLIPAHEIATLVVNDDDSLSYAPVVNGEFQYPRFYQRTHLVLIKDGVATCIPTSRICYNKEMEAYEHTYEAPELP